MSSFIPPVSEHEKETIEKIRQKFGDELPKDLDTDFNLRRWANGWKHDMKQIEPRLRNYIQTRKAFKLDAPDLLEQPFNPILQQSFRHMSASPPVRQPPLINPIDNTVVIVYRFENMDIIGLVKAFTPTDYCYLNFAFSEYALRHVLNQEKISGKPSGLSLFYDMHGIHYGDFINPSTPHMKLGVLVMQMQQDYYCDLTHQVVCLRAPTFISIIWGIFKNFMNEVTQKKFIFYTENKGRQHIFDHFDPSVVPAFYGGQWREDQINPLLEALFVKVDPEKCCTIAEPVAESEYVKPSWTPKEWTTDYIRPKETLTIVKSILEPTKTKLQWQFEVNANVEFAVYYEKAGSSRQLIHPKLVLCTPIFPEERSLSCADYGAGDYIFEFSNHSTTWFSLKLTHCIMEVKNDI